MNWYFYQTQIVDITFFNHLQTLQRSRDKNNLNWKYEINPKMLQQECTHRIKFNVDDDTLIEEQGNRKKIKTTTETEGNER